MGYNPRAMIFGGGDNILMCVTDADESKIMKNITRSIELPKIEDRLSKLKKQNLLQSLAYMSIEVKRFMFLMQIQNKNSMHLRCLPLWL
jgi:hypothetical protein